MTVRVLFTVIDQVSSHCAYSCRLEPTLGFLQHHPAHCLPPILHTLERRPGHGSS